MVTDSGLTDEAYTSLSKKSRIVAVLITVRNNGQWVSIRDLSIISSRQYIYRLLDGLETDGHVIRKQVCGADGHRRTMWQATESADRVLSKLSNLKGGRPPRGPHEATRRTISQHRTLEVQNTPIGQKVAADRTFIEKEQVFVQMDPAVAGKLRALMNPPGPDDRAEQYYMTVSSFSLSINSKDLLQVVLTSTQWSQELIEFCLACGVSKSGIRSLVAQISAELPQGILQVETPLLATELRRLGVHVEIDTQLLYKGKATDYGVHSNINYSHNIDRESSGVAERVDRFVSVLFALQHDAEIALQTLRLRELEEAEEREEQRKRAEAELEKRIAQEESKSEKERADGKEQDYYA